MTENLSALESQSTGLSEVQRTVSRASRMSHISHLSHISRISDYELHFLETEAATRQETVIANDPLLLVPTFSAQSAAAAAAADDLISAESGESVKSVGDSAAQLPETATNPTSALSAPSAPSAPSSPSATPPSGTGILNKEVEVLDDEARPPDGGYGWICVLAQFMLNFNTWGAAASYGIYLAYYLDTNHFPHSSPLQFAFIGGLSNGVPQLVAPGVTKLLLWMGSRQCIYVGCVFQLAGLLGASYASQMWQLFLSQGVAFGLGVGLVYLPSMSVIPQWFQKRRSVANGICAGGSGLGGLVYSLVGQRMISNYGVHWALRTMAIMTVVLNVAFGTLVRSRNHVVKPSGKLFDAKALLSYPLMLIIFWQISSLGGFIVLLFSLSTFARSLGLTAHQGAVVLAVQSAAQTIGRPALGFVCDKYGRVNVTLAATAFNSIMCFAFWIPLRNYGGLIGFGIVAGFTMGVSWVSYAPLTADASGLKKLPSAFAFVSIASSVPLIVSEAIALELKKSKVSNTQFIWVQVYSGCCFAVSSICIVFLRELKVARSLKVARLDCLEYLEALESHRGGEKMHWKTEEMEEDVENMSGEKLEAEIRETQEKLERCERQLSPGLRGFLGRCIMRGVV